MKKLMIAVAMTTALPAAAVAQASTAADSHAGHRSVASANGTKADYSAMRHGGLDQVKSASGASMDHRRTAMSEHSGHGRAERSVEQCDARQSGSGKAGQASSQRR